MSDFKKIVLMDFDGVIHSYSSGWQGAHIVSDPPVQGSIRWLKDFMEDYCMPEMDWKLCIYSARSRQEGGVEAMQKWLLKHGLGEEWLSMIDFPTEKPPAFVTVDDRAIRFCGAFSFLTDIIVNFEPWTKRGV